MLSRTLTSKFVLGVLLFGTLAASARAHFIWLVPESSPEGASVQVYFGEDASPDDPELLKYVDGMQAWQLRKGVEPKQLELTRTEESLSAKLDGVDVNDSLIIGTHDLGVMERGGSTFRLMYNAKSGPAVTSTAWKNIDCSKQLPLDVVPSLVEGNVQVLVTFNGHPVEGAEVKASGPGLDDFDGTTDATGLAKFKTADAGLYSIRARHVAAKPGELDGKEYPKVRYYTTISLPVELTTATTISASLPPLETPVTSFGGAILDGSLYIYGGHSGGAHSYSKLEQGHQLLKLDLAKGEKWEAVAEGPYLQGLALVAHGNKLYRIGGFTAQNAEGEEHDLVSQTDVTAFDTKSNNWVELPALPEARSSHYAAVIGDTLYVVGGWALKGQDDSQWQKTARAMNRNEETPKWTALPQPPFQRRAAAAAAYAGKLYVIGGMQSEGGPTRKVAIFDPATGTWSEGPEIVGDDGMTGFGASSFATGGRLYVSTIKGTLQRLSDDGSAWEVISETPTARFFHRMLPVDAHRLLVVGGASMQVGKFDAVEVLQVK